MSSSVPLPLSGVRVADFSHIAAGPYGTLQLAYFGAEVVKIESREHPDGWRIRDGNRDLEQSRPFADHNKGKLGVTLNLKTEAGVGLAKRIIARSDVVVENFSFGVMDRFGLGYAVLKELKPDLIMVSLQGLGSTGPKRDWVTWGPSLMPFTGLTYLWSLPDAGEPVGSQTSYPDYVVGAHAAFAILAALHQRDATGRGQFIDLAQAEVTAALVADSYMDYFANGRVPRPQGNARDGRAPCGCFPCAGQDRWCVLDVADDHEWAGLVAAMGEPAWARQPRYATLTGRLRHQAELEGCIADWTRGLDAADVVQRCQSEGVAAAVVASGKDLAEDEQLRSRGLLVDTGHARLGSLLLPGPVVHLSDTPAQVRGPAPLLGQDTDTVLTSLLGLTSGEIEDLRRRGALT